jgi:transposase
VVGQAIMDLGAAFANFFRDCKKPRSQRRHFRYPTIRRKKLNHSFVLWNELQYKATMHGGHIVVADRFFPSTQICSGCGCLSGPKGREQLNVEQWICRECGAEHDRDINALAHLVTS